MAAQMISETLLRNEIERYKSRKELSKDEKLLYSLCRKELLIIERLKLEYIDLCGDIADVMKKFERQSLYFIEPEKYKSMSEKARRYDKICDMCKEDIITNPITFLGE